LLATACSTGGSPTTQVSSAPVESTAPAASAAGPAAASASAVAPAAASASARPPDDLSAKTIFKDAEFLAAADFRGRGSGTEDETRAGAWLAKQLDAAGIPEAFGPRTVPFKYSRGNSANVLGLIAPKKSEKQGFIVLGAHYDHVGVDKKGSIYFGAEDNASGTAVVLGVARALIKRKEELDRPVIVAFFGAEEHGLHGSKAFVAAWPLAERPISMMVNVDMIGRTLVDQPLLWIGARAAGILADVDPETAVGALVPDKDPSIAARVKEACQAEGVRAVVPADLPKEIRGQVEGMSKGRGDHYPFELKGVPFVFFSSGESSDYHQPTDTADRLEPEILESRARAILRFVVAESRR
jgi:hypothetical protein